MIILVSIVSGLPGASASTHRRDEHGSRCGPGSPLRSSWAVASGHRVLRVRGTRPAAHPGRLRQAPGGPQMYAGQTTHLPFKLNMSGVIPPIFAVAAAVPGHDCRVRGREQRNVVGPGAARLRPAAGHLPLADDRREQVAGRPPRSRGRAHRPALQERIGTRRWPAACGTGPRARRRISAPRASSRPSTTSSATATAPRARSSSTRRTTTCAKSWPKSCRHRRTRAALP